MYCLIFSSKLFVSVAVASASLFLQGPLKETCGHFWLMVWEQNSRAVIMLNRIIEREQVCQFAGKSL